jgi:hypothetical protein
MCSSSVGQSPDKSFHFPHEILTIFVRVIAGTQSTGSNEVQGVAAVECLPMSDNEDQPPARNDDEITYRGEVLWVTRSPRVFSESSSPVHHDDIIYRVKYAEARSNGAMQAFK